MADPESRPPFGVDVLRAIVHAGGAVHCADDGTGLVGASVLTFCAPGSRAVYSMIAAARTRDRGVGFAVKQAQRAWALQQGATSMLWTFDPLVSRNARFNLVKLGATAVAYETDFYGRMDDGIEGDGETDRLTAAWSLAHARTGAAAAGRPLDSPVPTSPRPRSTRAAHRTASRSSRGPPTASGAGSRRTSSRCAARTSPSPCGGARPSARCWTRRSAPASSPRDSAGTAGTA
ncbi:hypothetical protein ACFQHO_47865 [Actinomadura yumaensis]|uniref:hypothetical protein n=1 Tax=Actinomadura yumaensis TaxID=111807 RepID=UPI00361B1D13